MFFFIRVAMVMVSLHSKKNTKTPTYHTLTEILRIVLDYIPGYGEPKK